MKIPMAVYHKGEAQEKLFKILEMNDKIYETMDKRKLFCPEPNCYAKILYFQWNDGTKFFKTWNNDEHITGCPYTVDHNNEAQAEAKHNEEMVSPSENAIKRSLRMAYNTIVKKPTANISNHSGVFGKIKTKHCGT